MCRGMCRSVYNSCWAQRSKGRSWWIDWRFPRELVHVHARRRTHTHAHAVSVCACGHTHTHAYARASAAVSYSDVQRVKLPWLQCRCELQRQLQELLSKQDYTGAAAVQSEIEKVPPLMVAAPPVAGQGVVAPADAEPHRLAELQRQLQELVSKQDYAGAAAVQSEIEKAPPLMVHDYCSGQSRP